MHLKSGHAAPSFWVQPLSCGSDAGLRRSSRVRANASLNSSTGDDPPGSQRHTHSSEAAKHVARSEAVKESRNSISGTGMDVPGHSSAVDRLDSPHKPTADGPSYPVTVQVLGRLNKTVYKSDMEEAILDITYEVVDEGKKQARHQVWHMPCLLMNGSKDARRRQLAGIACLAIRCMAKSSMSPHVCTCRCCSATA